MEQLREKMMNQKSVAGVQKYMHQFNKGTPKDKNGKGTGNHKNDIVFKEVENIFENSDFIYMLNQAVGDRQILAKQLNISPHQLSYVTHSGEGEGLLFYGNVILPFVDRFPTNTELYRIMTTRLSEVADAKKEQSA